MPAKILLLILLFHRREFLQLNQTIQFVNCITISKDVNNFTFNNHQRLIMELGLYTFADLPPGDNNINRYQSTHPQPHGRNKTGR